MAEKEYIERDAVVRLLCKEALQEYNLQRYGEARGVVSAKESVNRFPAADVAPVVHAEWEWHTEVHGNPIDGMDEDFGYRCSNCKVKAEEYGVDGDIYEEPPTRLKYCPNCGAILDGGTEKPYKPGNNLLKLYYKKFTETCEQVIEESVFMQKIRELKGDQT